MRVRVRMYRQGLGDCFLLSFGSGEDARHVLIDCGSLGAKTTGVRMKDVAASIRDTTGGRIDLLIATHEHEDHLDGFRGQRTIFTALDVRDVWLAWTENPKDTLARSLKKYNDDIVTALAAAAAALVRSQDAEDQVIGAAVRDLLGFVGETRGQGVGFAPTVHEAMELVRTGLGATPTYLQPSETPIEPAWLPGWRIYVLGPPRRRTALQDLGDADSDELFHVAAGLDAAARFHASGRSLSAYLNGLDGPARTAFERERPFDVRFCLDAEQTAAAYRDTYDAEAEAWRRIDRDWLHAASDLALQLDNMTNNTSLALAFERIADGKVLLFPADAQQGNWLSWHWPSREWTVTESDGSTRTVRAPDLLARTVFYKVGHHGSHNATAKGKGLDLMTNADELVAFIPVDRDVALGRNPKGTWRMPARALLRALLERCQGRVVRSDLGWAADAATAAKPEVEVELANLATTQEWTAWQQSQQTATRVQIQSMFVDFVLD